MSAIVLRKVQTFLVSSNEFGDEQKNTQNSSKILHVDIS